MPESAWSILIRELTQILSVMLILYLHIKCAATCPTSMDREVNHGKTAAVKLTGALVHPRVSRVDTVGQRGAPGR